MIKVQLGFRKVRSDIDIRNMPGVISQKEIRRAANSQETIRDLLKPEYNIFQEARKVYSSRLKGTKVIK